MTPAQTKPYHHGDLRRALLDASLKVLFESGAHALTLRAVARRAGVSHTAPYRHFADKDELLAAVTEEGFVELKKRMLDAASGADNSIEALERSGVAYVKLAIEHPAHCSVMFSPLGPELRQRGEQGLSPQYVNTFNACEAAFGTLIELVAAAQRDGYIRDGDTHEFAVMAWSQVHGIANLAIAQLLTEPDRTTWTPEQTLAFAEHAVKNLSRGFAPSA